MTIRGLDRGETAALLTIECQNGIVDPERRPDGDLAKAASERGIVDRIADLADVCRSVGIRVFHNKLVHRADWAGSGVNAPLLGSNRKRRSMVAGTPEVDLCPGLRASDEDFQLERLTGVTPFYGTSLEILLRNCGVQTVILTGVSTNLGIPGAMIEAVNRGFSVVIPEDCTAGVWPEAHEFHVQHTLPVLSAVTTADTVAAVLRERAST